ncbi:hypothetical protein [Mycobacterium sp. URHB0021]
MTSDTLTTALTSLHSGMPRSLIAGADSPRLGEYGRPSQAPGYKR